MKVCLVLFFILSFASAKTQKRDKHLDALEHYFRILPYNKNFDRWIDEFKKDSSCKIDTTIFRSPKDSLYFYLSGSFKNFQPYNLPSKQSQFVIKIYNRPGKDEKLDTLGRFGVFAYISDSSILGRDEVKKEYNRLYKEFRHFYVREIKNRKRVKKEVQEEVTNFYLSQHDFYPSLVLSWGKNPKNHLYGIVLFMEFQFK